MEVILSSMEEILKNNLVDPRILQKMVEKLISNMHKYFFNLMKLILKLMQKY